MNPLQGKNAKATLPKRKKEKKEEAKESLTSRASHGEKWRKKEIFV